MPPRLWIRWPLLGRSQPLLTCPRATMEMERRSVDTYTIMDAGSSDGETFRGAVMKTSGSDHVSPLSQDVA